jgi:hypothetical protein
MHEKEAVLMKSFPKTSTRRAVPTSLMSKCLSAHPSMSRWRGSEVPQSPPSQPSPVPILTPRQKAHPEVPKPRFPPLALLEVRRPKKAPPRAPPEAPSQASRPPPPVKVRPPVKACPDVPRSRSPRGSQWAPQRAPQHKQPPAMPAARLNQLSRSLSYILRHRESLEMDRGGWVSFHYLAWWCYSTEDAVKCAARTFDYKKQKFRMELNDAGSSGNCH